MRRLTAVVIGAGDRGTGYANYALDFPEKLQIVGVADPRVFARERLQRLHNIPKDKVFADFKDAAALDKFADIAIITTPDALHKDPAVALANKGYHILLEKPIAITEQDCKDIIAACRQNNIMLSVGHVLRYYPPMKKIKEIIESGQIGEVINIQHLENVGYWHFAHSYVRGNWCNEAKSTFSLLAKCCHDVDLISWWMGKRRCTKISSFGSLAHFKKENKPKGASSRCLDCKVEHSCPYSAKRFYLNQIKSGNTNWPISVICSTTPSVEAVTDALRNGPYGKCVYDSDNDVCDNQVVNMEFEGGVTASLTMIAFTKGASVRDVRVFGSKGEIRYSGGREITVFDFLTNKSTLIKDLPRPPPETRMLKHDGADFYMFDGLINAVMQNDPSLIQTRPDDILTSHLLVFEAEKARRTSSVTTITADLFTW